MRILGTLKILEDAVLDCKKRAIDTHGKSEQTV